MPDSDADIATLHQVAPPDEPEPRWRLSLRIAGIYALPALVYAFAILAIPPLIDTRLDASVGGWLMAFLMVAALAAGVRAMRRFPTGFGWVAYGCLALTIALQSFALLTNLLFDAAGTAPTRSLDWLVQPGISAVIAAAGLSMLTLALMVLAIVWAAAKAYTDSSN